MAGRSLLKPADLEDVIDEVLRGNNDAFRRIIREFTLYVRSYIASQVHHLDVVDDLSQDVFFAAYRNLGEFRRGDDFLAWLRGIARNKVYEHFRSVSRRHKAMERFREEVVRSTEPVLDAAMAADSTESIEVLLHCIAELPERMRKVVRAGLDGSRPTDMAEELGTSVGAVYSLHYRANQMLRACMRKVLE